MIANGYGAMPDYGDQLKVEDRWAVVAYIRALELSRHATVGRRAGRGTAEVGERPMSPSYAPSPELVETLQRWRAPALIGGAVLLVASVIGAFFAPGDFFRAWLIGFLFWQGLVLGSMAFLMLQYLTGGAWAVVTRRTFEAATRTLPADCTLLYPPGVRTAPVIRMGKARTACGAVICSSTGKST